MLAGNTDIISIVLIYFLFLILIGLNGYRKTNTFSDYIIGGRKLGPVIGAMNVGASDMSSWVLMGLPGAFYLFGLNQIWIIIGLLLGSYASWKIVAIRLRKYTEIANNSLTLSSFLENRFQDKSGILRVLNSVVTLFFFTFYIASGFVGSASLFSSLFEVDYQTTLFFSIFIIISYALIGGFLAVSWGDLFQGILILFALIFVPFGIFFSINGFDGFFGVIQNTSPNHLNPFYNLTFFGILTTLGWGLGYFGQPHIISKFMSIKDSKLINSARRICITWTALSMIGAASVGILGYVFFIQNPLKLHETVFLLSSKVIFSSVIMGFVVAAFLAAIMSTINGQIILSSGSLTEDFYRKFFRKNASDKELIIITRFFVVVVAFVGYFIAKNENATVLNIVSYAWSGLGASIGPIILLSLFWKRATKYGAMAGILSGAFSSILYDKLDLFAHSLLPAFLTSTLFIVVFSLLSLKHIPSNVEDQFKKIKNA